VGRILLANELLDPAGLDWLLAELARDPRFEFCMYVDSPAGVAAAGAALDRREAGRPLDLLVELGVPGGRTGCRTVAEAVELAHSVCGLPGARLVGIAGYEGVLGHDRDAAASVRAYLGELGGALEALAGSSAEPPIVTAGGSMWFDLVVEELGPIARDQGAQLVLRSGCYVTHDHGTYAASGPGTRHGGPRLRPALRLWAQVLSVPEPGLALAGFGRRDCSFDTGLPVALERLAGNGHRGPVDAVQVLDLNDQHAFLQHDGQLQVGDVLSFGISHPCTTFDKWRVIPVVDDDLVVTDCLTTWF
jgi:D-serine deaminase-like pyridoxal phosphate-dependent protein